MISFRFLHFPLPKIRTFRFSLRTPRLSLLRWSPLWRWNSQWVHTFRCQNFSSNVNAPINCKPRVSGGDIHAELSYTVHPVIKRNAHTQKQEPNLRKIHCFIKANEKFILTRDQGNCMLGQSTGVRWGGRGEGVTKLIRIFWFCQKVCWTLKAVGNIWEHSQDKMKAIGEGWRQRSLEGRKLERETRLTRR